MNTPAINPELAPASPLDSDLFLDPREEISYGVLMANGRLAPRAFASREEAEAWAQGDEQVVSWNYVCGCDR